jgi:hypothetical protein
MENPRETSQYCQNLKKRNTQPANHGHLRHSHDAELNKNEGNCQEQLLALLSRTDF